MKAMKAGFWSVLILCMGLVVGAAAQTNVLVNEELRDGVEPTGWTSVDIFYQTTADGYARFDSTTSQLVTVTFDAAAFVGIQIDLSVAKFGSGDDGPLDLEYSLNAGGAWQELGATDTPDSSTYLDNTLFVNETSDEMQVRFTRLNSPSQKRLRDVVITGLTNLPTNELTLTIPASVDQSNTVQGTVSMTLIETNDVVVSLSSSAPADLQVSPSSVTISNGLLSADFDIIASTITEPGPNFDVTIDATATGFDPVSDDITVINTVVGAAPLTLAGYTQNFSNFVSDVTLPPGWEPVGPITAYEGDWGAGSTAGMRGNDNVFGYQHTSSSGTFEKKLSLSNDTGETITNLTVSYLGRAERTDQDRITEYTVSVDGVEVPALAYSTADGVDKTVLAGVSGLSIATGAVFEIIWSSDRGEPSGTSRQIGISDVDISLDAPVDQPPILSLDPAGTEKSVFTGNPISFDVIATQVPEDAGQNTEISALEIPAGATFPGATGAAPVQATFDWTPMTAGVYTSIFVAADIDGSVTQAVTITVLGPQPAPEGTIALFDFDGEVNFPSLLADNLDWTVFEPNDGRSISYSSGVTEDAISANGWNETNRYWEFSLIVDGGFAMSITNIFFQDLASGTGPTNWFLRTSVDSFAGDVGAGGTSGSFSEQVVPASISSATGTVTVRIFAEGASSGAGTWRIDDFLVQGIVEPAIVSTNPPIVTTPTSADIDGVSATLGGRIDDTGDSTVTERGIYWSVTESFDPELDGTKVSELGSFSNGVFTIGVTDVEPDTTIYFRAFARNGAGEGYSEQDSFASEVDVPKVENPTADSVDSDSASLGADITSDGGLTIDERGVKYSTDPDFDPATEGTTVSETGAFGEGVFALPVTGLTPSTEYTFVGFAVNSEGTNHSAKSSFTTAIGPPPNALVYFTFTGDTNAPEVVAMNLTGSNMTLSTAGAVGYGTSQEEDWTGSGVPYAESSGSWGETNRVDAKYFTFAIDAEAGWVFSITNISLLQRATGAGPTAVGININTNDIFAEDVADSVTTSTTVAVVGYDDLGSAEIRIQGWDNGSRSTTGGGAFRIDDVLVQGTVSPDGAPEPGEVEVTVFVVAAGGSASATFMSEDGVSYSLEYTTDLTEDPVSWTLVDTLIGDGGEVTLDDDDPADTTRIYRIVTP